MCLSEITYFAAYINNYIANNPVIIGCNTHWYNIKTNSKTEK
jgi:hypothetical protein